MVSSISSLSQLDIRSSSPSPFTPSAGGRSGSPTSPHVAAAQGSSGVSETSAFHETVDVIKKGHLDAARRCLRAGPLRDELEEEIERDCESLREFLYAAQVGHLSADTPRPKLTLRLSTKSPQDRKTRSSGLESDWRARLSPRR
jgi:hypothetical protein